MNQKIFLTFVLSLSLGFLACYLWLRKTPQPDSMEKVMKELQDSLHTTRDSMNRELATLMVINADAERSIAAIEQILNDKEEEGIADRIRLKYYQVQLSEALRANQEKDQQIEKLTILANESNIVIKEVPVIVRDTVREGNKIHFFQAKHQDPENWFDLVADIYLSDDEADFKINVRNDFSIFEYKEGKDRFVQVRNNNPYTYTTGAEVFKLNTFADPKRKSRFGMGFHVGLAQNLKPVVSVGINYDLIRF